MPSRTKPKSSSLSENEKMRQRILRSKSKESEFWYGLDWSRTRIHTSANVASQFRWLPVPDEELWCLHYDNDSGSFTGINLFMAGVHAYCLDYANDPLSPRKAQSLKEFLRTECRPPSYRNWGKEQYLLDQYCDSHRRGPWEWHPQRYYAPTSYIEPRFNPLSEHYENKSNANRKSSKEKHRNHTSSRHQADRRSSTRPEVTDDDVAASQQRAKKFWASIFENRELFPGPDNPQVSDRYIKERFDATKNREMDTSIPRDKDWPMATLGTMVYTDCIAELAEAENSKKYRKCASMIRSFQQSVIFGVAQERTEAEEDERGRESRRTPDYYAQEYQDEYPSLDDERYRSEQPSYSGSYRSVPTPRTPSYANDWPDQDNGQRSATYRSPNRQAYVRLTPNGGLDTFTTSSHTAGNYGPPPMSGDYGCHPAPKYREVRPSMPMPPPSYNEAVHRSGRDSAGPETYGRSHPDSYVEEPKPRRRPRYRN